MLMIVLALSPIFSGERAGGFDKLIISSGKRKAAIRAKLISSGIYTFSATALFFLLDALYVAVFHGLSCFNAPVYAISEYADCPFTITLLSAMLLSFAGRLIAMLFFFRAYMLYILFREKHRAVAVFVDSVRGGAYRLVGRYPGNVRPVGACLFKSFP